jgi:hypothetical protein
LQFMYDGLETAGRYFRKRMRIRPKVLGFQKRSKAK